MAGCRKIMVWMVVMLGMATYLQAQTRYLVQFKYKGATNPYSISNPSAYLSQRSIGRRTRYAIAIDSTDLPVNTAFLDSLRSIAGVTVLNASKWLNQVSVQITDATAIAKIQTFSFVRSANSIAARKRTDNETDNNYQASRKNEIEQSAQAADNFYSYGSSAAQLHIHNGEFLHNIGLRGQNMQIGMLDAGYFNYTSLRAFDSMRLNGQVLESWDFVERNASVVEDAAHGMECLSVIAANVPGQFVGTAPKASFYLYRSEETATEYPIEEHNWVCAAERLDSAGGDVISSSLGYTTFDNASYNHSYSDFDGNTTIAARGADLAVKKGILVVNAVGNDGDKSWHYLSTPADGDSVMAVGGVFTNGTVAPFSSFGPSADGQVKPDVVSVGAGTIVQYTDNNFGPNNGTSFACPNMAGLATCLWQGFPEFNNMKILNALRQSGSLATKPTAQLGYGIPDVRKATMLLLKDYATANINSANCRSVIQWSSKDVATMKYEIERKSSSDTGFRKIAEMQGSGTVFSNHSYSFTDTLSNLPVGTISYRIKQVLDTAVAFYLDTRSASITASCASGENVTILPNPARTQIEVQANTANASDHIIISIVNLQGQTVARVQKSKPAGAISYTVPVYYLSSGKYFVCVYEDGRLLATKELLKL